MVMFLFIVALTSISINIISYIKYDNKLFDISFGILMVSIVSILLLYFFTMETSYDMVNKNDKILIIKNHSFPKWTKIVNKSDTTIINVKDDGDM